MKHFRSNKHWFMFLLIAVLLFSVPISASKNKAQQLYEQGDQYAAEGRWDLAADAYAQAAKEYSKYKDVQNKLNNARTQACLLLVQMGDDAKVKEKFDEALALYQRALSYNPTSVEAKSRLDNLAQEMVARYYTMGRNYESQNQLQSALAAYEKAYACNPDYQDLADRYIRIKAKLQGNLPLRAVLFFINHSPQQGMETPLILSLQTELEKKSTSGKYVMLGYRRVQSIMTEQAAGLGDNLNDNLAMDIGRILGADQVVVGEITAEGKNSNKFKITAWVIKVPQGEVYKKVEISHSFSGKEMADFEKVIPELAKNLADKITHDGWF